VDRVRVGQNVDFFNYNQYYWIISSRVSSQEFAQRNIKLRWITLALSVLLTIANAVMVWFYVRNKIVNQLALTIMEDVSRLNDSLIANSSVISGKLELSDTLKEALKSAKRLSNAKYGALSVLKNGAIDTVFADGLSEAQISRIKESVPEIGISDHTVVDYHCRSAHLSKDPEACGFPMEPSGMKSMIRVPIVHQGQILGMLYLTEKEGDQDFSQQDEKIVTKLADHVGAVIQTAIMYEELKLGASIFDNSIEGITITDTNGTILKVNNAFTAITGYPAEDVIGKNPRLLKSNRHDRAFYRAMWDAIGQSGKWEGEIWNRRKNGETYPEWLSISAITNFKGENEHYVAVFHDISEVKKSQEKLAYQAHHDALTGLPNRQLFHDRLSMALNRAVRHDIKLAVLFLDLDNFKIVNDTLGHRTGDLLLQGFAERLTGTCREEDTVARLGGDEFIILMSDLDNPVENATRLAQRIIACLDKPFQLSENECNANVSIGITFFPGDGESAEDLIKFADMAMYKAKNEGKNQYALFTDEMNQNMLKRVSLESDLRKALSRNEFELHYQPKINIDTGFLSGSEALIRWNRNGAGLVPPNDFIPIAEEAGIISEIGTWVLYQACKQTQAWRNKGYGDLAVAVNLSPKQMMNDPIESIVEKALCATGLPPESLTLEITENIMVFDVEKTIAIMERISKLGVHWSMDDFGTGYSSIRYLQRLPLNEMKIDRSFVKDIPENEASSKIVLSTVALASSFGLKVVAEGVENDTHLKFLSACRCNEAQGYFFSKPLPPDEFGQYLERNGKMNWIDYIVASA
jgi:diguanylate cyclase (GGDEF)-like protein/PAS domain S-box-containing protein